MFGNIIRMKILSIIKISAGTAYFTGVFLVIGAFAGPSAFAQMYPPGGAGAPGDEMFKACGFCHGTQGQGRQRLDAPPIAALPAWYVERQMHNFIDEIRGDHPDDLPGHQMNLITPMFRNDATVKNVAEYVETLEPGAPPMTLGAGMGMGMGPAGPEPTERPFNWESKYAFLDVEISSGDADAGKRSYQQYCIACHGPSGEGIEALGAPPMNNLADWYMARQLQYFRDGVRGTNSKDIYGTQMAAFGRVLADDRAIADVIAYIKTLQP